MAIVLERPSSRLRVERWAKNASTVFTSGDVVSNEDTAGANGFITMTASLRTILGIIQATTASTDDDYATEGAVRGVLMDEDGIFRCDVGNGTAELNDEGGYIDMDPSNPATEVDVEQSTEDHFLVQKFVSTAVVLGRITAWAKDSITTRAS